MILECEMCAKRISKHSGTRFCVSCQKEITQKKGREAAGIPTEERFIKDNIHSSSWSSMGRWESTGKGRTYIDNSPGAAFNTISLLIGFAGVLTFFVAPFVVGVLLILVALIFQTLKGRAREQHLSKEYKEKYSYLNDLDQN